MESKNTLNKTNNINYQRIIAIGAVVIIVVLISWWQKPGPDEVGVVVVENDTSEGFSLDQVSGENLAELESTLLDQLSNEFDPEPNNALPPQPDKPGTYQGIILAGSNAPLLDFNPADYAFARAAGKNIVLYFYAKWCPDCIAETAGALYPAFDEIVNSDVVGFRVNYKDNDTSTSEVDLAKEFNITYQHTKVFLNPEGEVLLKDLQSWDEAKYIEQINQLFTSPTS